MVQKFYTSQGRKFLPFFSTGFLMHQVVTVAGFCPPTVPSFIRQHTCPSNYGSVEMSPSKTRAFPLRCHSRLLWLTVRKCRGFAIWSNSNASYVSLELSPFQYIDVLRRIHIYIYVYYACQSNRTVNLTYHLWYIQNQYPPLTRGWLPCFTFAKWTANHAQPQARTFNNILDSI